MKQIIVLVGPKGAGKSTIGDLLAEELGIHFLRVEPLFLDVRARLGASDPGVDQQAFEMVGESVRAALLQHEVVCFETTGASTYVPALLSGLACIARVLPVHVLVEPDQCLERIHRRDASVHVPVSDDQVDRVNAVAARVALPWAAVIDNRGPLDPQRTVSGIRKLLGREVLAPGHALPN